MSIEGHTPIKILLVDDRPENLVALQGILRSSDYHLVTASSGEQALQLALRETFAVILLDVVMPTMDGFEVARYLKQAERTRNIPILFLTAVATDVQQIYTAYEVGAVDYLIKPLDGNIVRSKVAVFVDLVRQREQIAWQAEKLREAQSRDYELRLAELRIASDRRYRKLVEGINHAVAWSADAEGRLTFVSRQASRLLGYEMEAFLEPGFWSKHLHPGDRERVLGMFRDVLNGKDSGRDLIGEHRLIAADGGLVWFHTGVSGAIDDHGRPELHGISVDITALKQGEALQALLADVSRILSESLDYRAALPQLAKRLVADWVNWCLIDELVEPGRLVQLAASHADPAREASVLSLGRCGDLDRSLPAGVARVAQSGTAELHKTIPDASWLARALGASRIDVLRTLDARACLLVPLAARGRTLGVVTLVLSGGGRPLAREDLSLAQEVGRRAGIAVDNARLYEDSERARQAREGLLAIVSHDLRNPLGAILTGVTMLERAAKEEAARKYVAAISRAARRMERLISDLLDFAQAQAGQLTVESRVIEAGTLVRDSLDVMRPLAENKRQQLSVEAREDLLVFCDRDRVLQVLSNIVGNAIKFTPEGGSIALRLGRSGEEARFEVADTGPGIPEVDLIHIWERFWRSKPSGGGGLGLGLSIAKGLVEAMGGRIWAESKVGAGTTFYFTLRLAAPPPQSQATGREVPERSSAVWSPGPH